jgi:hypothetical protein
VIHRFLRRGFRIDGFDAKQTNELRNARIKLNKAAFKIHTVFLLSEHGDVLRQQSYYQLFRFMTLDRRLGHRFNLKMALNGWGALAVCFGSVGHGQRKNNTLRRDRRVIA